MRDARRRYGLQVAVITPLTAPGEVVFHAPAANGVTLCGRRAVASTPRVHVDHASLFARPCRQCWRIQQLPLFQAAA